MLNIVSQLAGKSQFCDGVSRRRMLQIGALGTFGLNLQGLLRAEQGALPHPAARSKKSVILVWMHGGPSQLDTFDMKPGAPTDQTTAGTALRLVRPTGVTPVQPLNVNAFGRVRSAGKILPAKYFNPISELQSRRFLVALRGFRIYPRPSFPSLPTAAEPDHAFFRVLVRTLDIHCDFRPVITGSGDKADASRAI